MNRESQTHVGLFQVFVVLGVLVFFTCQSFAGVSSIYKWKDEQGKIHFTDDPLKIPLRYRSDPNLEKIRGLPSPKSSSRKQMSKSNADSTAEDQAEQDETTDDSDADKKKEEVATMQAALNFLKSDVQRYKKYKDYVPQHRHAVVLRDEIVNVIPAKDALVKKLGKSDSTLLKQVSSYLKISLQRDYEAKKREHPRRLIFISERSRINEEQPVKNQLIKRLTAELASTPEKAASQPKPAKPQEPAENSKQDASKNARKYGAYGK
jgi:hypothetical protein